MSTHPVQCPEFCCVEVGTSVYSKTCQFSSGFPVGGVVIDVFDDHVIVLPNFGPKQNPDPRRIDEDDIDNSDVAMRDRFYSRNAGVAAMQLFGWLAIQKPNVRSGHSDWAQLAVRLQMIRDGANLTPRAERRTRDALDARLRGLREEAS